MGAWPAGATVVVLAFDGIQSLDVIGPVEVFDVATRHRITRRTGSRWSRPTAAPVTTTSGITITPGPGAGRRRGDRSTRSSSRAALGVEALLADAALVSRRSGGSPRRARRVASVCTGAFILAEAGLLDGRRVTTHWASCRRLARRYPDARRGPATRSSCATATSTPPPASPPGIDLCLALVEEDHGRDLALAVARQLVVFLKRPGGQAQFSSHLSTQLAERDVLAEVQGWIADHLDEDLSVARLAERAAMSPRHFARVFRAETGVTPARFVEQARVEQARRRLEESTRRASRRSPHGCGFGTPETMRRRVPARAVGRPGRVPPALPRRGRARPVEV